MAEHPSELTGSTLLRIREAETLEQLEAIRVDVLGRKGKLAQFGKQLGSLAPAERAEFGKALNAAKDRSNRNSKKKKAELERAALDRSASKPSGST